MNSISHPSIRCETVIPFTKRGEKQSLERTQYKSTANCLTEREEVEMLLKTDKFVKKARRGPSFKDISHLKDRIWMSLTKDKFRLNQVLGGEKEFTFPSDSKTLIEISNEENTMFPKAFQVSNQKKRKNQEDCKETKGFKEVPGRQDASNLKKWFGTMKNLYFCKENSEKLFPEFRGVVITAVKELSQQITVACIEQGELLMEIIESYSSLLTKCVEMHEIHFKNEVSMLKSKFNLKKHQWESEKTELLQTINNKEQQTFNVLLKEQKLLDKISSLEKELLSTTKLISKRTRRASGIIRMDFPFHPLPFQSRSSSPSSLHQQVLTKALPIFEESPTLPRSPFNPLKLHN